MFAPPIGPAEIAARMRDVQDELRELVDALDLDAVPIFDVEDLWKAFDTAERLSASAHLPDHGGRAGFPDRIGNYLRSGAR